MAVSPEPAAAMQPEDLGAFFLERANAGDVDGLVALYEPGAVLAFPPGQVATGHEEIRAVYTEFASWPTRVLVGGAAARHQAW